MYTLCLHKWGCQPWYMEPRFSGSLAFEMRLELDRHQPGQLRAPEGERGACCNLLADSVLNAQIIPELACYRCYGAVGFREDLIIS